MRWACFSRGEQSISRLGKAGGGGGGSVFERRVDWRRFRSILDQVDASCRDCEGRVRQPNIFMV